MLIWGPNGAHWSIKMTNIFHKKTPVTKTVLSKEQMDQIRPNLNCSLLLCIEFATNIFLFSKAMKAKQGQKPDSTWPLTHGFVHFLKPVLYTLIMC